MRLASLACGIYATLTMLVCSTASAGLNDGRELWYRFDGDSNTPGGIADVSGNSRNGSGVDNADADGNGVSDIAFSPDVPAVLGGGQSLDLSATPDYLLSDTPGYQGIDGANARTVAAWVKVTEALDNPTIVEWGTNANDQRWTVKVNTSAGNGTLGGFRVEVQGGFIISGAKVIDDGEWHHIAASFADDGTPDVEDVLLYVDGVIDNVSPPPTTPNPQPINTVLLNDVSIGGSVAFASTGGRPLAGLIDDVGIWSRALSPQEIRALAAGVPEPSSCALFALGLAAAVLGKRRR